MIWCKSSRQRDVSWLLYTAQTATTAWAASVLHHEALIHPEREKRQIQAKLAQQASPSTIGGVISADSLGLPGRTGLTRTWGLGRWSEALPAEGLEVRIASGSICPVVASFGSGGVQRCAAGKAEKNPSSLVTCLVICGGPKRVLQKNSLMQRLLLLLKVSGACRRAV